VKEFGMLKSGVTFDQAHSQQFSKLWEELKASEFKSEAHLKGIEAFGLFCAGIVDSVFHNLKVNSPHLVKDQKGFGIPR
jgi:hypothetical protein